MLALLGPFGVAPRCMWVAFGGIQCMAPHFSLTIFSSCFWGGVALILWKRNRIVDIIAYIITPFKLGTVLLLIVGGFIYNPLHMKSFLAWDLPAFQLGLLNGYQTMDLIAAFFFASTIYEYIQGKTEEKFLFRRALQSVILSGGILAIVYICFALLGSVYADQLIETPPELMLGMVAKQAFGVYGLPIVALTFLVSCFATATVLSSLFVDFISQEIALMSRPWAILTTIAIAMTFSYLGFASICGWLGWFLEKIYPLLIFYTLWRILQKCCPKSLEEEPL